MTGKNPPYLRAAWDRAVSPPQGWSGDRYFLSRHNHAIRYAFAPAQGEERGTIVVTHGYGENIDLYYETIKEYQRQGFAVWAMDWHGHGKSGRGDLLNPRKPNARDILRSREDLHDFATSIIERDRSKPLFLSTHSMGGHISMLYMQKYKDTFDGAVMSAPLLDLYKWNLPDFLQPVLRGIFHAASWLGLGEFSMPHYKDLAKAFNSLAFGLKILPETENFTIRNSYNDDIRRRQRGAEVDNPTVDWIRATFATTNRIMDEHNLRAMQTPVLIGSAANDRLVDNDAHRRAAALMPNGQHVSIDNAQHALWFEDNRRYGEWMDHVGRFLDERVAEFTNRNSDSEPMPDETPPSAKGATLRLPAPRSAEPLRLAA